MKPSSVSFSFRSLLQTCFYGLTASTAVIALLYPEQSVTFLAQNFDFWIAGEFIVVCSMAAFLGCRPRTRRTRLQLLAFFIVLLLAPIIIFQQWILGAYMLINLIVRAFTQQLATTSVQASVALHVGAILASFFIPILVYDLGIDITGGVWWVIIYYGLLTLVGSFTVVRK